MDAVHLMRAITGRDLIVKVEGCYHGHHDSVQVSVQPAEEDVGPADRPNGVAASTGIPQAIRDLTLIVGFNDLGAVARLLDEHKGKIAGMIVEPIMMNRGIVTPEPGYLQGLADLLHADQALLCFDEVKTGFTVGPGGATAALGVTPDITCLAKSVGGGLVLGALGGSAEVMEHVANDDYEMVGTFNGNPLSLSAARAMVYEIATPEAYDRLSGLRTVVDRELTTIIDKHGLPARVVSVGAKGCVTFSTEPVRDYRDFLQVDDRYNHAHWLMQHNGGVFLPPWGKTEQWLISVQHRQDDMDRFIENFAGFAGGGRRTEPG